MRHFDEDLIILRRLAQIIQDNNSSVVLDWYNGVEDRKKRGSKKEESLDWWSIVDNNTLAVRESDALIIEGSRFNYSQGFQTALALEHNKPVLNLYREDLPEYKEWPDKFFVSGISNPLFTSKAYKNEADLERIVGEFIRNHSKRKHELDVQLVLDANDFEKLEQLSRNNGKSKTSIIKDILTNNLD